MKKRTFRLQFSENGDREEPDFHEDLSAATLSGDELWVASDETTALERLTRTSTATFSDHEVFQIEDFIDLPAPPEQEIDIEGIAFEGHYVWVSGSHSLKRQKAKAGSKSARKAIKRLAKFERETNRFFLGRIPAVTDPETGAITLYRSCVDPGNPKKNLTAARLFGTGRGNMLTTELRADDHIGRFLDIPCKENGLDIEGLAVFGNRVFLGLRGPVLRAWAMVIEIELKSVRDDTLALKKIGPHKRRYKKHFLDLGGNGIREMARDGDDILILAGPTMDLHGPPLIFRWENAKGAKKEQILDGNDLEKALDLPLKSSPTSGVNNAEGLALLEEDGKKYAVMIYDDPGAAKRTGKFEVKADAHAI